jgi:uncharacterized protein (TIGR04255 family)
VELHKEAEESMRKLPDYDNPPVVETAIGVEFAPLEKWQIPHFGLFWQQIQGHYPHFEVNPAIVTEVERPQLEFGQAQPPRVELSNRPPVRCWFLNEAKTELIQVQDDRLIHNWRKVPGVSPYPHYEYIRPAFERDWQQFGDFIASQALGTPEARQCEVTYVNHIDRGEAWQTFADLPLVFPSWTGVTSGSFLPAPETVLFNVSYSMPEQRGRLRISVVHAFRPSDATETLQLTVSARGKPASSGVSDVLSWLDLGREWVVRGFTDFTSGRMHELWRRKE